MFCDRAEGLMGNKRIPGHRVPTPADPRDSAVRRCAATGRRIAPPPISPRSNFTTGPNHRYKLRRARRVSDHDLLRAGLLMSGELSSIIRRRERQMSRDMVESNAVYRKAQLRIT